MIIKTGTTLNATLLGLIQEKLILLVRKQENIVLH